MDALPDPHRSQVLRQQCTRILDGKRSHDIIGALEMLVADTLLALPGMSETAAHRGADAIAADIRAIITERFAAQRKGH